MKLPEINRKDLTFQLIVESALDAIMLVNKEGKIVYTNKKCELLFGHARFNLVGEPVEMLMPERYHKSHLWFREMFFKAPAVRTMGADKELFALRRNGTEFPVEMGLNPIVMADETLVSVSILDITRRKNAEERFRLVVEFAPNAMVLVNSEGIIALVNREAEILFGYERKELVGHKLELLIPERFRSHHPKHRDTYFIKPNTRPMGAGRELFGIKKDGTEIPVEIGLNPIESNEGSMVLASIIDITERKVQESIIRKQVRELETKNKELEQFTYIASHDLQEPLRTVSNYVQVFREDYSERIDANAFKYLDAIDNASKRMSSMVKNLLGFSRLGKDKKLARLDCGQIIEEVLADLGTLIKNSNADIKVHTMPVLNVYETEMRQLFQNLIINAIKFRKKGLRPEIEIRSEKIKDKWTFSVSDNGIGIAPEHFERVFHIYQRLDRNGEYEGNGIGLANCKKIVELHHGKIWIESVLGKGTTFHFTI